jgi:hypothetical protein
VAASLQAELQHTPSVQLPLAHCSPAVQAAPLGLRPHELFTHVLGATQSLSRLQVDKQVPPLQAKVPHDTSAGVTQLACPSHVDAGVSDDAVEHAAALHGRPWAKVAHAPARQAPVVPQVDCDVALHCS